MGPEIFYAATPDGLEAVAGYPVGELIAHAYIGETGWGISHKKTGYGMNLKLKNKDEALRVALVINDAADWSLLKLGDDGKPDMGSMKDKFHAAAIKGRDSIEV